MLMSNNENKIAKEKLTTGIKMAPLAWLFGGPTGLVINALHTFFSYRNAVNAPQRIEEQKAERLREAREAWEAKQIPQETIEERRKWIKEVTKDPVRPYSTHISTYFEGRGWRSVSVDMYFGGVPGVHDDEFLKGTPLYMETIPCKSFGNKGSDAAIVNQQDYCFFLKQAIQNGKDITFYEFEDRDIIGIDVPYYDSKGFKKRPAKVKWGFSYDDQMYLLWERKYGVDD